MGQWPGHLNGKPRRGPAADFRQPYQSLCPAKAEEAGDEGPAGKKPRAPSFREQDAAACLNCTASPPDFDGELLHRIQEAATNKRAPGIYPALCLLCPFVSSAPSSKVSPLFFCRPRRYRKSTYSTPGSFALYSGERQGISSTSGSGTRRIDAQSNALPLLSGERTKPLQLARGVEDNVAGVSQPLNKLLHLLTVSQVCAQGTFRL